MLVEPRHDLDKIAGPRPVVELGGQNAVPAVAAGAGSTTRRTGDWEVRPANKSADRGTLRPAAHYVRVAGSIPEHPGFVQGDAMALTSMVAAFAARGLLLMLFLPFSALDKILNFRHAVRQASEAVPNRSLATVLIFSGLGVEVFMSLAVLSGFADRMAALILAAYCVVTALLWKQFWKAPDFRLRGTSHGREVFWDFLKNLALCGGFLALAFGASATGFERFLVHPLASSHPYSLSRG